MSTQWARCRSAPIVFIPTKQPLSWDTASALGFQTTRTTLNNRNNFSFMGMRARFSTLISRILKTMNS